MWGVGVSTSVSTNNQESSIYNDTQIYNDTSVKDTLINNYITNITTRTENVNEIVKNFQNNVSAEADSIQKNTAKFAACMDMPDANIVQSNELVQNVSQGFEQLYEDAKVLKSVIDSTSDTQSTIDQTTKSSQEATAESEQKATQDQENLQETKQSFTLLNKYNSILREKFIYGNKNTTENFLLFGSKKKTDSRYFVNSATCSGFVNYISDAFGQKQIFLFGSNKNNNISDKISSQYQPLVEFVLNNYVNKKSEKFAFYAGNVLAYPKDKNDEQCRNFINFVRNRFSDGITRSDGALKVGTKYNALIGFTLDKYVNKTATTQQESFRPKTKLGPREYFRSLLYRHEPFCFIGCVDVKTAVSTNSQKSSAVNKSLQQNIQTQDIYKKIDTAYDKVVETINKMSETVNQTTNSLAGASSIQINELSFEDPADVCKMNLAGLNLEQKNKLEQNVELTTVIENINSLTQDNEVRAIMSDMMGLTQSSDVAQATKSTAKQTSEQTQKSTQKTTQTSGSWIMIVVIVVVVGLVGFMLFKAGSSKDGYFDASPIKKLTQKANKLGVNKSLNKMGVKNPMSKGVKNPMSKGVKNPMGKNANKPPKSSNKPGNKPPKSANNNNVTTVSTGDAVVMSSTSTGDSNTNEVTVNNNSIEVPEGQAIQA